MVAIREGTSKIMYLKMPLKRRQGRASANFDRDFITGSIARSPKLPVFNLLRGRF